MTETLTALITIEAFGTLSTIIIAAVVVEADDLYDEDERWMAAWAFILAPLWPLFLVLAAAPALRRFAQKMEVALRRPDHVLWRDGEQR